MFERVEVAGGPREQAPDLRERPVEVGGCRGSLIEAGEGPPLVLLATMLVRSRPYAPVIRRLARHFHVYAVDMPGCGRASRLRETWGFERYAAWADRLLDQLRLEQVTLVGHSNSAGTELVMGALYPDRLARIVLADTVGGDASPSSFRVLLGRALDAFLEPWLSLTGWHHLFYNALLHTRSFFGQVRLSIETDLRPYAPRVTLPVLLAWGARDHTMPLRCAHALESLLPNASLHVAPTGSHDWIITHAAEFGAVVDEWAKNECGSASRPTGPLKRTLQSGRRVP